MENDVHALHRGTGHAGFAQIGLQKIDFARAEVLANVAEMSAAQVIDDANFFHASCQQLIGKRRADERSPAGYKNSLARPKSIRRRHSCPVSLICLISLNLFDSFQIFLYFPASIIVYILTPTPPPPIL